MQNKTNQCSTTEPVSDFKNALNELFALSEDLGESKEDLHQWLDNFYLAYLLDSTNYQYAKGVVAEHFHFYSLLQKVIRLSDEVYNFKNLSH